MRHCCRDFRQRPLGTLDDFLHQRIAPDAQHWRPADWLPPWMRRKPAHCSNVFGPMPDTFADRLTISKGAMLLTMRHDVACIAGAQPNHPRQQGVRTRGSRRHPPSSRSSTTASSFSPAAIDSRRADTAPRQSTSDQSSPARPAGPAGIRDTHHAAQTHVQIGQLLWRAYSLAGTPTRPPRSPPPLSPAPSCLIKSAAN